MKSKKMSYSAIQIHTSKVLAFYKINHQSYLVREQFSTRLVTAISGPLKTITIFIKLIDLANRCGIMYKGVPIAHGFRKFFTTQVIKPKVNPEIRKMLLGHKIGLTSCYYRSAIDGMYEEYTKALDYLIVNPANRLQRRDENLTIKKSRLYRIEEKLLKMNKC